MKTIACYILHYGKEYLAWSIRSVQDVVDEIHILYSEKPSFGIGTYLACPDAESQLIQEAHRFSNKPIFWHKNEWFNEGQHRWAIFQLARDRGAEMILSVDADEVWDTKTAESALQQVWDLNAAHATRFKFINFYRSFDWVCPDPAMPIRVYDTRHAPGSEWPRTWNIQKQDFPVLHFGYAQSEMLTRYKMSCHAHQAHIKENWWRDKFLDWKPGINDVSPFTTNIWNPEKIDEPLRSKVKELMHDHPYFGIEKIV